MLKAIKNKKYKKQKGKGWGIFHGETENSRKGHKKLNDALEDFFS